MGEWKDTAHRVRIGRRKVYNEDAHFSEEFPLIITIYTVLSHIFYSNTCFITCIFRVKMDSQDSKVTWVLKVTG